MTRAQRMPANPDASRDEEIEIAQVSVESNRCMLPTDATEPVDSGGVGARWSTARISKHRCHCQPLVRCAQELLHGTGFSNFEFAVRAVDGGGTAMETGRLPGAPWPQVGRVRRL